MICEVLLELDNMAIDSMQSRFLQVFESRKDEIAFHYITEDKSKGKDERSKGGDDFAFAGVQVSDKLVDYFMHLIRCEPDALYSSSHDAFVDAATNLGKDPLAY